jgi:hypothetical protein
MLPSVYNMAGMNKWSGPVLSECEEVYTGGKLGEELKVHGKFE